MRDKVGRVRTTILMLAAVLGVSCGEGARESLSPSQQRGEKTSLGFTIQNPYARPGTWHRANFHLHSIHSDGAYWPQELAEIYGREGYTILSITDHNTYGSQDGGILDGRPTNRNPAGYILARFQTDDGVLHDWNGNRATTSGYIWGSGAEAYVRDWTLPPPGYWVDRFYRRTDTPVSQIPLLLSGFEASPGVWGCHFGYLGYPPGPVGGPSAAPDYHYLDTIESSGGFAFIAHPGGANYLSAATVSAKVPVHRFHALEVINGLLMTYASADADATPLWDTLLRAGFRLWGMANDDAHTLVGSGYARPFTAFNMVLTDAPTESGVLLALHSGAFYASTGLRFDALTLDGADLVVNASEAHTIEFYGADGLLLRTSGPSARYQILGSERYVRVVATGPIPYSREPQTTIQWPKAAWSQPFFVQGRENLDTPAP